MTAASAAAPDSDIGVSLRAFETAWPLAGSPEFDHLPPDWRARRAHAMAADLRRHVMDTWFPRCVDRERGGFLCDFNRRWQLSGSQVRMLEFQSRQTRTVARLGRAFPGEVRWLEYARHGVSYLDEVMRDPEHGGWYWLVDRDGRPQANGTKHAHSTAYLISAYVEAYRLTGDPAALESAKAAFEWLDAALHDAEHGGYRTWATRSGEAILSLADGDLPDDATDPLGHGVGLKDANVHSDLLEGMRLLYAEWPDPVLRQRLTEIYEIFLLHHGNSDGSMHYVLEDDLTPVPGPERFGYPAQSGSRMVRVAPLIGASPDDAFAWAKAGLAHVLRDGRHRSGAGILNESGAGRGVRPWWVQAEVLQMMLLIAAREKDGSEYATAFDRLMTFVDRELLDHDAGGWYPRARSDWPLGARLRSARVHKGDRWKDSSHESDLYLTGIRILRGIAAETPIEP